MAFEEEVILAIVIPAYKERFLYKSLCSLLNQTDKRFKVYLFDDASPSDLLSICQPFFLELNICYHRFENNLGKVDLVAHWNRCVKLTKNESWIWLFSDDDIAEPNCVELFYKEIEKTSSFFDVYRFDTIKVDEYDKVLQILPESPVIENSESLALNILLEKRGNAMPDHIFKKSKYMEIGGFVNFAFGQSADWATSIEFSKPYGLRTIKGAKIHWRYSSQNISSNAWILRDKAIFGYLQFLEWLKIRFNIDRIDSEKQFETLSLQVMELNLFRTLKNHYRGVPWNKIFIISYRLKKIFNWNIFFSLYYCLKINYVSRSSKD